MKTRITSETYRISKPDETGLIPRSVVEVVVTYDNNGKPNLYYKAQEERLTHEQEKRTTDIQRRIPRDRLNNLRPTTPEGIEKVVEYLRQSCKG